jgi:hypothetical protein
MFVKASLSPKGRGQGKAMVNPLSPQGERVRERGVKQVAPSPRKGRGLGRGA